MSFELVPSLTEVGGILVEGYKRLTRASEEEKEAVGIADNADAYANIGVASVEEYVTMSVTDVGRREMAVFDLMQFQQPMRIASLYIDDPRSDSIVVEAFLPDDTKIMKLNFSRNRTPYQFPSAPLPPHVKVKVTALSDTKYIQLVLIPVVILENVPGTKEDV